MKKKTTFLLLIFLSFIPRVFATNFYTASASATLGGNTGAVNANWTTNSDGITGLTTVAMSITDNLIILNGGTVTISTSGTMNIGALTINNGGTIIHANNATGTDFNIRGLLTWNGNIKTLQAVSGSNFFNVFGDIVGSTAQLDLASNRTVYVRGDGLRTISLTQVATSIINTQGAGINIYNNRKLVGNCKWYSPLIFSGGPSPATILDLNGYDLQVSSIQTGNSTRLLKCNPNSSLSISGGQQVTTLFLDPSGATLKQLTVDSAMTPANSGAAINITGDLAVSTLYFGLASGSTLTRSITVNGNIALADNGTMRVETKGTTAGSTYDQLKATGNITIGSATTLQVDLINSYSPPVGSLFNFVQSTGVGTTIIGSFTTVKDPKDYVSMVTYPSANTLQYKVDDKICSYTPSPDLPLVASNATIDAEIETIYNRYSDAYLGTVAPTTAALNAAIASYNALGITVNGNSIAGTITNYSQAAFLKTFAQQLKFHPEDTDTYTKALNTVWLVSSRICQGVLAIDGIQYDYTKFAQPAILIPQIRTNVLVKNLFENVLYKQNDFDYIWKSSYQGGINIDHVGNSGTVMMAYAKWLDSADERYRYMTAFKRMMGYFMAYTPGTMDGIKSDGSSFHHNVSYPGYTYNYNTAANIVYYLRGTSFEVNTDSYLRLRDAMMAQAMICNDIGERSIAMAGRNPHITDIDISRDAFRNMAVAGGSILGTGSSDPVVATLHNRIWPGTYAPLGNATVAPFNSGFFQMNHSMAGIYRKNDWVATIKGFNDNMMGAETYGPELSSKNRFGRYQSYGVVDIMYPGTSVANGYDVTTRDWNFVPGATVIRLPWNKLDAEKSNQEQLQQKRFAGSLSFINKNSDYLKADHGTYGMFAMDFQEQAGLGWGTSTYSSDNHNATFVFKKSVFAFDNMLICLGSNIGNNDAVNTTLTTLYQRKAITGKEVVNVDSNVLPTSDYSNTYDGAASHWLIDNFSTGFYVFPGSGTIKLTKANQQTPQHDLLWNQQTIANNPVGNYAIGYLDHGTAPSNQGYEYICIPGATATDMTTLNSQIGAGNKPYTVHRKDNIAHIVEYKPTATSNSIFGYSFFSAISGINNSGQVTSADYPCLVMSQYDSASKKLALTVNNPDLGFLKAIGTSSVQSTPSVDKQINIKIKGTEWELSQPNTRAVITGTANGETTIQFTVVDGLPVEITVNNTQTPSLSIGNFERENGVTFYPNPVKDVLYIDLAKDNRTTEAQVFDMQGRMLLNQKLNGSNAVNVSKLSTGIYIVKIYAGSEKIVSKKIIKK
ncbi:chondroitinase family polysaccharide lyase [Flavobacterium sp. WC2509]|uniref:chondroitinase family polysaccharide lyase n=1 Tax=Flavobacterium sp. WC2509 TaxID=3461406 RepID=UPI004043D0FB